MKEIHNYLRDLRKDLGLSQESMADDMGISQSKYSKMETGKKKIELKDIEEKTKVAGKDKTEVFQKLNGMTIENIIHEGHDNQNVINVTNEELFRMLLEVKDKLIIEKDKRIEEKDAINQEQKRYIEYLEDKLKNVGLL
jgi:transcriptional regulator with XRE-family HTH domain